MGGAEPPAATRSAPCRARARRGWRAPDLLRSEHRGTLITNPAREIGANFRYHGAVTPSAWLTSYRLAGDNHLDCSEIEDGYGGKSCGVGAGQQAGGDGRHDRPSPAADRPISRRSGSSGCDYPSVCSRNGAGNDPAEDDPPN